jgi:hypothetical protein
MLVGGVVVEHHMAYFADWDLRLDDVEEPDKLLMSLALHAAADDLAFEHIERRELRRRAVPFVIMRQDSGAALLHRQAGLSAVTGQVGHLRLGGSANSADFMLIPLSG